VHIRRQFQAVPPPSARAVRVQKQVCACELVQVAVQNSPWIEQVIPEVTPEGQAVVAPASEPGMPPVPPSIDEQLWQANTPFGSQKHARSSPCRQPIVEVQVSLPLQVAPAAHVVEPPVPAAPPPAEPPEPVVALPPAPPCAVPPAPVVAVPPAPPLAPPFPTPPPAGLVLPQPPPTKVSAATESIETIWARFILTPGGKAKAVEVSLLVANAVPGIGVWHRSAKPQRLRAVPGRDWVILVALARGDGRVLNVSVRGPVPIGACRPAPTVIGLNVQADAAGADGMIPARG
jgi:hypothetical protein